MGEKLIVGPINKGLKNDRLAFVIDNDSFPTLINAYQWRGRIKRKRGTSFLNRLRRFFSSTSSSYSTTATITLNGSGAGNILTGFGLQSIGNIVPGTVTLTASIGPTVYTDPTQNGFLTPTGTGGPNTINYATGAILIPAQAGATVSAVFNYFPDLPVMGLRELTINANIFPGNIAFDTTYSYNMVNSSPYSIYDVSFYKNPPTGTYTNYVQKTNVTPTSWNGEDYQQFWTINYEGAFWATNGIEVPFTTTNIGMQFKPIITTTVTGGGPPATVSLQITGHGLVVGDFVFINEVVTTTGINFQTGYVTTVTDANNVVVTFPNATIATNGTGGIAQYLTSRSDVTKDCIRWYDGDPTNGNATTPTLNGRLGWVNFMPPLSHDVFAIGDLPAAQYYLVGAKIMIQFKDRILFLGPVVQTSTGNPVYLQDTIVYSQNGTPFYTASFTGSVTDSTTVFTPLLVPTNKTAAPNTFFSDVPGFGGNITAGYNQPITTVSSNEDVLIVGFTTRQTRVVYLGDDIIPFAFFIINSELGSSSTFSAINFDRGVNTIGEHGIIMTSQVSCERIDLEIPDQVFQFNLTNNGTERITSARDFINEWVYWTYPDNDVAWRFPNQTLQYNYRDHSWAIFNEAYTTYGQFRRVDGETWATIGNRFPTWAEWNEPWGSGSSTLLQAQVIAGNQQGFVVFRDDGTTESNSLFITGFSGKTVTSPDHCLNSEDFIVITGCIGTISNEVNGKIFQITVIDKDTFDIHILGTGTYFGGGLIKRLYRPQIQTKQFPVGWDLARKTRLGPQQYLFTKTPSGQITLQIFLSQNGDSPYNFNPVLPEVNSENDALVYTDILFTCPESSNLGLTPANTNLNLITASQQSQIWHRMNTSLLGDTVQIGFTLSNAQMSDLSPQDYSFTITGATQATQCVLTCANTLGAGQLVLIEDVEGMTELNGNTYNVVSATSTNITLGVNSTAFTAYTGNGTVTPLLSNQFSEIELHGFVLDVSPSQVLA